MKKVFYSAFISILFFSCTKETPATSDSRDKFLGYYTGTVDYYDETFTYINSIDQKLNVVKDPTNNSEVTITASAADNSNPATYNGTIDGNDINASINLTGSNSSANVEMVFTLSNNTLSYQGVSEITNLTTGAIKTIYAIGEFAK